MPTRDPADNCIVTSCRETGERETGHPAGESGKPSLKSCAQLVFGETGRRPDDSEKMGEAGPPWVVSTWSTPSLRLSFPTERMGEWVVKMLQYAAGLLELEF